jgi:WD40 repeat protein
VIRGIGWSPDSQQLISAARDKTIKFWNSSTGRQIGQPCIGHADSIYSLAIASDGSFIATASEDKTVRLWSTKTYQQIGQPLEHPNAVLCAAISTNGALLASGTWNKSLYLWSIGNMLQQQDGQEGYEEELEIEQQPRISEIVSLQFLLLFHDPYMHHSNLHQQDHKKEQYTPTRSHLSALDRPQTPVLHSKCHWCRPN